MEKSSHGTKLIMIMILNKEFFLTCKDAIQISSIKTYLLRVSLLITFRERENKGVWMGLTDNWQMVKILTDNWQIA